MERLKVAIVGSGPGGLSAAARAATLGMSHVLLEREAKHADTIQKYARGKFVMATPDILPRRSDMSFEASSRETVLDTWADEIKSTGLSIRYGATVTAVKGAKGAFVLTLAEGGTVEAEHVILAIGLQGNLRKLGVPGDTPPMVQYQLDDPKALAEQNIVVIGAGDAAIENAIALAEQNQVTIVNRQPEFARAKTGNLLAIEKAIRSGLLQCAYQASPVKVAGGAITLKTPDGIAGLSLRSGAGTPRRRPAAQVPGILRHRAAQGRFGLSGSEHQLRNQRAGPLRHRGARRLSADQAVPEPGLRGDPDDRRQPGGAGGRATPAGAAPGHAGPTVGLAGAGADQAAPAAPEQPHHPAAARVPARQRDPRAPRRRLRLPPQRQGRRHRPDRAGHGRDRAARPPPARRAAQGDHPRRGRFLRRCRPGRGRPPHRHHARPHRHRVHRAGPPVGQEADHLGGTRARNLRAPVDPAPAPGQSGRRHLRRGAGARHRHGRAQIVQGRAEAGGRRAPRATAASTSSARAR